MNRFHLILLLGLTSIYTPSTLAYTTYARTEAYADFYYDNVLGVIDDDIQSQTNTIAQSNSAASFNFQIGNSGHSLSSNASAYSAPGMLKAYATASSSGFPAAVARAEAQLTDSFRLIGPADTSDVLIYLIFNVTGNLTNPSDASGNVRLTTGLLNNSIALISFGESVINPRNYACSSSALSACGASTAFRVPVNTDIGLRAALAVSATATGPYTAIADYGHTALLHIGISDARYQLASNSGHNYSPVPLPPALLLFATGLAGLMPKHLFKAFRQRFTNAYGLKVTFSAVGKQWVF